MDEKLVVNCIWEIDDADTGERLITLGNYSLVEAWDFFVRWSPDYHPEGHYIIKERYL